MAAEDVLVDLAAVDLEEILVAQEDLEDLECRGYPVALEDLVVPVVLAAPEVVPPEEAPREVAAAEAAVVEEVGQAHPTHQSSTSKLKLSSERCMKR